MPPRSYTSTLRAEQAANTRQRILDAAALCFTRGGYAGTSLADIATEAGVSVETVKLNGPKRELLMGAFEQAFSGSEGRETIAEREVGRDIRSVSDHAEFLRGYIHFVAEANRRTSGLWASFLSAASSDPLVQESLDDLLSRRRVDFAAAISELERRKLVPAGLTDARRRELADVLSFIVSPESHQQLVEQSGWSMERYEEWLLAAMERLVFAG
ncbi:TetR/AcrR family transcriptional regulator [Herbiconiux moechotypicola]|uniref:TetR/AcrR family transcriptional regulator n=1 Tax=Herbiconiux moechotypicola TaxID=637393 RepID=A0ABN3E410_9MICO|nr:TetR/AcrR family transcriptional regulator [Herbiconiux moechotypicola]MCS5731649.1 TetR/AcrR family transcriptional regulator [Herbiconiux moechotypicola]